jgi:formate hydrogenlyase subunit 3/multisubunit Na+/H+ antiporter MnhD subunit
MFSTGRIIFALVFALVFIVGLIYSYKKDKKANQIHYNKTYLILLGLLGFVFVLYLIVKIKNFL